MINTSEQGEKLSQFSWKDKLNRSALLGWSMALGASLSFSFAPPVARWAIVGGMDPTTLLVIRLVITVLLLAVATTITNPAALKIDGRGLFIICIAGAFNGFAQLLFFWSLTRLDASMTSMILSTLPVFVLIFLALRGEKFTRRNTIRIVLALGGAYLLIGPGGQSDLIGALLALSSVLLFAIQLAIIQWYLQSYVPSTITLYITTIMFVVIGGWWLLQGAVWQAPGLEGWLAILILAVVCTYLARILLYGAIRHIGSGQVSLLMPLEMLLSITWSMLFLHERLTYIQSIGGLLILTSALLAVKRLGRATWRPRWRNWSRL